MAWSIPRLNPTKKILGDRYSKNSSSGSDTIIESEEVNGLNIHLRGQGSDANGYEFDKWPEYTIELFKWGEVDKIVGTYYNYKQALAAWQNVVKRYKK